MTQFVAKKTLKVAILLGGRSGEREISLKTGESFAKILKQSSHIVTMHDVTETLWEELKEVKPDVALIALHGKFGEDGTVQGMLELLNIPYTGSGVLASALAMNKLQAKRLFKEAGIPTPLWWSINRGEAVNIDYLKKLQIPLPIVVKPNESGSAIGVKIVKDLESCLSAIKELHNEEEIVLLEEYLPGREVSVGVIGIPPEPLPVIEIIPKNSFYDYEAKYAPGMSQHILPALLPKELYAKVEELAVSAHKTLGCKAFSRTDIWISNKKGPLVLEVNTLPGMTETSLYPEMAKAFGIEFPELLERFLAMALEKKCAGI